MALIAPRQTAQVEVLKGVKVSHEVYKDIQDYLVFAEMEGDLDWFIESAAAMVIKKDKDFAKWKKEQKEEPTKAGTTTE